MTRNFEIIGIATNLEDGTIETKPGKGPQQDLTVTKRSLFGNTLGKLVLSIIDYDPTTPNVMKMLWDGEPIAIRDNDPMMGTNTADQTEGRFKAYYFDTPTRFIEAATLPATFTIQFILGHMENDEFVEEVKSNTFTLTVTE